MEKKIVGKVGEYADSALKSAAGKLGTLLGDMLVEEAKMALNVRKDAQYIQLELESMAAFIRNAEERQDNDAGVKAWVKEVKEIAFDTEDCIEDFIVEVQQQPPAGGGGGGGGCFQCCIKDPINFVTSRHRIGVEIKSIRDRVTAASDRAKRYNFVATTSSGAKPLIEARNTALFVEETDLVGIQGPRDALIKLIADEGQAQLTIIPVVGMGGLGKTTLVRKVFESQQISGGQFQRTAWVTASQFSDTKGILEGMFTEFFPDSPPPAGKTEQQLIRMLIDGLKGKRYIIVLDDLWTSDAWNSIKLALPDNKNGCRVMITTRKEAVAATCAGAQSHDHIYKLQPLSPEQSLELLCKTVFSDSNCPPDLREPAMAIIRKCEGLPRAIVTIGSVLATKPKNRGEWQEMHDRLGSASETDPSLRRMSKILTFSYDDLPYHLKACFVYLSVFPHDSDFRRTRLVRRWMAEGFAGTEEAAGRLLKEFIDSSIIQPKEHTAGKAKSCSVHDLVLEIAISKAIDDNFVTAISERSNAAIQEKTRHLSIQDRTSQKPPSSLPHLRSLTMFRFNRQLLASTEMRLLRVLDLEGCEELQDDDLTVVGRFLHLRYLSLRKTKVRRLPDAIGKLLNLQTLDIRNTEITTLPASFVNLINLTCFLAGKSDRFKKQQGVVLPQGMGPMQAMMVLSAADANGISADVGRLTRLRKFAVTGVTKENVKQLAECLAMLSGGLQSLSIWSAEYKEPVSYLISLDNSPRQLRTLEVGGRLDSLPSWIASLKYVSKITLCGSKLEADDLQALQKLPSLLRLILIDDALTGFELSLKGGFPKLKELHVRFLSELKRVMVSEEAAPDLEKINVWSRTQVDVEVSGNRDRTKIRTDGIQIYHVNQSDM